MKLTPSAWLHVLAASLLVSALCCDSFAGADGASAVVEDASQFLSALNNSSVMEILLGAKELRYVHACTPISCPPSLATTFIDGLATDFMAFSFERHAYPSYVLPSVAAGKVQQYPQPLIPAQAACPPQHLHCLHLIC